jgi:uncharacterized protein YjiK
MNKLCAYILSFAFTACSGQQTAYESPPGYDLSKPEKFLMPDVLNEISGISFYKGNNDTLYTEQDEEGKLYYLHLGDKKANHTRFEKKGDYEDITIINDYVILLRSDGTLFSFPFGSIRQEETKETKEWKKLVPDGEYEGLYGDTDNKLYVLCKQCKDDKESEALNLYILQLQPDGSIVRSGSASINVKAIGKMIGEKKLKFHPSALAKNPKTGDWYVVSSVNRLLLIANDNWNVKEVFRLKASDFRQPEGIAFDSEANLYISNEGDKISKGNVLKFKFRN